MGLVRDNTNSVRKDFEAASSSLIKGDSYRRSSYSSGRNTDVSSIDFNASRRSSGVELRWHPKEDFLKISKEQRYELMDWSRTDEDMKQKKLYLKSDQTKRRRPPSAKLIINLVVETESENSISQLKQIKV